MVLSECLVQVMPKRASHAREYPWVAKISKKNPENVPKLHEMMGNGQTSVWGHIWKAQTLPNCVFALLRIRVDAIRVLGSNVMRGS